MRPENMGTELDSVMSRDERFVGPGVIAFATSCAGLMLQCVQTRVLSVVLWNHFVYFIVSIALLGYGISGTWLALGRERRLARALGVRGAGVLFVLTTLASTLLVPILAPNLSGTGGWRLVSTAAVYLVAVPPYFACGWILGITFRDHAARMHALYFADLAGAATGCILFVLLIRPLGVVPLVVLICLLACLPSLAAIANPRERAGALALLALLAPLLPATASIERRIVPSPDKMEWSWEKELVQDEEAIHEVSEWNTVSRIDVVSRSKRPSVKGFFIDGDAWTQMLAQFSQVRTKEPRELAWPYVLGNRPKDGLVIGTGGGYEVFNLLCAGVSHLDAVEINPTTYRLARDVYRDFNGGLFTRPQVSFHNEDGRSFVRRADARYDIIMMQGVDTFTALDSRAYVLSESYLYTVDAATDYLEHLTTGGRLYMGRANTRPESLRTFVNAIEALTRLGTPEPERCILVHSWGAWMAILVKRTPFTEADFAELEALPFWVGGTTQEYPLRSSDANVRKEFAEYAAAHRTGREATEAYLRSLPYDVSPVTDDCPFFFHFERWRDLPAALARGDLGESVRGNWPTLSLAGMLFFTGVMVVVFMLLPLAARGAKRPTSGSFQALQLGWHTYFACLGVSFIFIEMALMQRFALLLGHPSRSLVLVLGALLFFAGVGSAAAGRLQERITPFVPIVLLTLLAAFAYPAVAKLALPLPLWGRTAVTTALVAPIGFFLGMPLPLAIRRVSTESEVAVPWMWGINGGATVLGSVLATVAAMAASFTFVLALAALGYLIAGILWWRLSRGTSPESAASRSAARRPGDAS